ncbi:MAG: protein kinase [archaeon]|nr:protein kinase [archaeon]
MDTTNENIGKIIEGFKIIKFLGRGKFSVVYQAERQTDNKLVALKIIKTYDIKDKETLNKCLKEVNLLKTVDHPYIVRYLDSFTAKNELYIAIEWADKGDVRKLIKKYKQEGDLIEEAKVVEYTREIASALVHMHEKRIIHRDLKPANILIFSDGIFKLGDLGLGRAMSEETIKAFSRVGTPLYMAPEVINNNGYDFKSDYWSLGCVVYELITLRSPFQVDGDMSVIDLFKKINTGNYPKIHDERYKFIVPIVDGLLKVNPEERIDLHDVVKQCEEYLKKVEDKPRIDPFIVMDDIFEKLRLIDYEENFCKKYKHPVINKFYFACSVFGYGANDENFQSNEDSLKQFSYFYNLSNWLIGIINQNINLTSLYKADIKFQRYNTGQSREEQMNNLISILKSMDVKVLQNSKFKYGYGEGVCLVLTQLCDKYLIKQNFIFKKPKFVGKEKKISKEDSNKDFDRIMVEDKIGTQIGFKANTNYNFGMNFKPGLASHNNSNRFSGVSKKRFNSATSTGSNTNTNVDSNTNTVTSGFSGNEEDKKNNTNILNSNIDASEWNKEFQRVQKNLVIQEVPECIENSDSTETYTNPYALNGSQNLKCVKKLSNCSSYFKNLSSFYEELNYIQEKVDYDLNKIQKLEKNLANKGCFKDLADKLRLTTSAINSYKTDLHGIEENIKKMEKEKRETEKNLQKISEIKEDLRQSTELFNKKTMNLRLDNLRAEANKMQTEEDLFNNFVFSTYSTHKPQTKFLFKKDEDKAEEINEEVQFDEEIE